MLQQDIIPYTDPAAINRLFDQSATSDQFTFDQFTSDQSTFDQFTFDRSISDRHAAGASTVWPAMLLDPRIRLELGTVIDQQYSGTAIDRHFDRQYSNGTAGTLTSNIVIAHSATPRARGAPATTGPARPGPARPVQWTNWRRSVAARWP